MTAVGGTCISTTRIRGLFGVENGFVSLDSRLRYRVFEGPWGRATSLLTSGFTGPSWILSEPLIPGIRDRDGSVFVAVRTPG